MYLQSIYNSALSEFAYHGFVSNVEKSTILGILLFFMRASSLVFREVIHFITVGDSRVILEGLDSRY